MKKNLLKSHLASLSISDGLSIIKIYIIIDMCVCPISQNEPNKKKHMRSIMWAGMLK